MTTSGKQRREEPPVSRRLRRDTSNHRIKSTIYNLDAEDDELEQALEAYNDDTTRTSTNDRCLQTKGVKRTTLKRQSGPTVQSAYEEEVEHSSTNNRPNKSMGRRPRQPPTKRKKRTPTKGITKSSPVDDQSGDEEENDQKTPAPKRRQPRRSTRTISTIRPKPSLSEVESSNESHQAEDEDEDDNESVIIAPLSANTKTLKCPHCPKTFGTDGGLRYHVANFVCQPDSRPGGPVVRGRRGKSASGGMDGSSKRKFRRIRGAAKDRTCPDCHRVFTSVLGMTYHREKAVCHRKGQKDAGTESSALPFGTLEAGSKFVTNWGVVQVIRDDRATPVAEPLQKPKDLARSFQAHKSSRENQLEKQYATLAVLSLTRRKQLLEEYKTKADSNITPQSVWMAYFGTREDPREIPKSRQAAPFRLGQLRDDPLAPENAFADRIVECIAIADDRRRFVGLYDDSETTGSSSMGRYPTKLFLSRRLLTESYNPSGSIHMCPSCGRSFGSKPGCKYHLVSKVCTSKSDAQGELRQKRLRDIEDRSLRLLAKGAGPERRKYRPPQPVHRDIPAMDSVTPHKRLDSVSDDDDTNKLAAQLQEKEQKTYDTRKEENVPSPDECIKELFQQLRFEQSKQLGPMYTDVFRVLKFKRYVSRPAKKRKKRKIVVKKIKVVKKVKRSKASKESTTLDGTSKKSKKTEVVSTRSTYPSLVLPPPPLPTQFIQTQSHIPIPPIIDTRVLVGEVDAGRYPSIKRDPARTNQDICSICKRGNRLVACDFCPLSVHFRCVRTKYLLKDPEPEDDFMCNTRIQYIWHRRARAEKRRIQKLGEDKVQTDQTAAESVARLTKGAVEGEEYECVASQARRLADLSELLMEAKVRLKQNMAMAKVNDMRRAMISGQVVSKGSTSI
jgi:hypothetical protein